MADDTPTNGDQTQADIPPVTDPATVDSSQAAAEQTTMFDAGEAKAQLAGIPIEFGRYRLLNTIGEGGMGRVYLAHDTQLDRQVAMKVPHFRSDQDHAALKRFLREARAAALLRHPNICPIYDVGEIDGTHFLTMAFIEGQPLSAYTSSDTLLSQQEVAVLLSKTCRAMDEAHSHDIVHRDLKPANVMIDGRGEPIIMDFGLARHERPGDEALTQEGAVMGTPAYMSPEQVDGDAEQIGPPTDIYSLGVMLFELVSGRRPFVGSVASLMAQVLRDEPPALSSLRHDVESKLDFICTKALAKRPEDRYESAGAMADAIDRFLSGEKSETTRLSITGTPKVIEAPSEPIDTYGLSGISTEPDSETDGHDAGEVEELRVARVSAKIQKLLGETKLATALVGLASLPDSKDRIERLPPLLERCQKRISRLLDDDRFSAAIAVSGALRIAVSTQDTLNLLIETAETASEECSDDPINSLDIWVTALSCSAKDRKVSRKAAVFANKQAVASSRSGKLAEAVMIYRQAVKWDDSPVLQKNMVSAYRKLAASAIDAGKFARAEKICRSGLSYAPDDSKLKEQLKTACKSQG